MLLRRRGYLVSKVWFELRDGRGHPCILHGFYPRQVTNNTDGDCFASSGRCIGQENSRPRFGIIMTHLRSSHVVRSDFRSLLSCCYLPIFETIIPRGFENGFGRGFPPEVVCLHQQHIFVMLLFERRSCLPAHRSQAPFLQFTLQGVLFAASAATCFGRNGASIPLVVTIFLGETLVTCSDVSDTRQTCMVHQ